MVASERAVFPSGTAAASSIAAATVSQSSVVVAAGDQIEAHVMLSAGVDTSITLAATLGGIASSGTSGLVHCNTQNAGAEQVFWWLNPSPGTVTLTITASGGATPDALGLKVRAIAGSDGNAPTVESAGTPNDTTNRTAATSSAVNLPAGSLGISHFVAGSNISSTGQTNDLLANVGGTGAAISMAGATAAGAGSNVTFTATISAADWYAEIVTVWAAGGGGGGATPVTPTRRYYAPRKNPALESRFGAFKPLLQGTPPVAPHADPPYFSDRIGGTSNPVFIMSAEDWAILFNGGTADGTGNYNASYDNYFTTRAAQGYNGVEVTMFSQTNEAGGHNGPDGDGVYPWDTNSTDPTHTPNTTFWARRDYFLASALSHGFYVFLNPSTAMLDQGGFPASWTTAQWQAYGTFLGTRYPASSYPQIMWILGDDYFGTIDSNLTAFLTNLRAAGGTQPMSYQAYQEATSRLDIFHPASTNNVGGTDLWGKAHADYNWGYSYNAVYDVVEKAGLENDTLPPIPYMFGDGVFLNTGFTGITSDNYGRRMIWWGLSSGSKSFNLGDNHTWQWDTGSQTEIATASFYNTQVPAIMNYWRSLTGWHRLIADTSSQLVTGGRGTHISAIDSGGGGTAYTTNTDSYVTASRTPDGTLAVIYMSHASTITIDESKMVAGYTATWVDPASGATSTATPGPTYNSGSKGSNSVGDADWALVLAQPSAGNNFTQNPTDSAGLTDNLALNQSKTINDPAGPTDTIAVDQGKGTTDLEGLTDTLIVDQSKATTDNAGLTDTTVIDRSTLTTDSTGLTDTVLVENGKLVTSSDVENLTDTTIIDRGTSVTDPAGLTDTTVIDQSKTATDGAGLTDSTLVENGKLQTQTDNLGLTDTQVLDQFKAITDQAGLSDLAALTQAKTVGTDSTGLTDSVTVLKFADVTTADTENLTDSTALTQSPVYSDPTGLTDTVTLIRIVVSTATDLEGLTDTVTVDLIPFVLHPPTIPPDTRTVAPVRDDRYLAPLNDRYL